MVHIQNGQVDYDEFLALMNDKRHQELTDLHETLPTPTVGIDTQESIGPGDLPGAAAVVK